MSIAFQFEQRSLLLKYKASWEIGNEAESNYLQTQTLCFILFIKCPGLGRTGGDGDGGRV